MIEHSGAGNVQEDRGSDRLLSPTRVFDTEDIRDLSFEDDSGEEGSECFDGESCDGSTLSSDEVQSDDEGGLSIGEQPRHHTSSPGTVRGK